MTAAWAPDTGYVAGDTVTNDDPLRIYVVPDGGDGTSDSSGGPTGTGTGITDNTVTWDFVTNVSQPVILDPLQIAALSGQLGTLADPDDAHYVSVAAGTAGAVTRGVITVANFFKNLLTKAGLASGTISPIVGNFNLSETTAGYIFKRTSTGASFQAPTTAIDELAGFLGSLPSNQDPTDDVWTVLNADTQVFDAGGVFASHVFTVPSGVTYVTLWANVLFVHSGGGTDAGTFGVRFTKNGSPVGAAGTRQEYHTSATEGSFYVPNPGAPLITTTSGDEWRCEIRCPANWYASTGSYFGGKVVA